MFRAQDYKLVQEGVRFPVAASSYWVDRALDGLDLLTAVPFPRSAKPFSACETFVAVPSSFYPDESERMVQVGAAQKVPASTDGYCKSRSSLAAHRLFLVLDDEISHRQ
jgi:hypothetical protein